MKTRLSILCDNCILGSGFIGEHGFGVLIERDGERSLFDTGPGLSLPLNLKRFKTDLKGLSRIFISHGHYDHTGGLEYAVGQAGPVEIVAHPDVFARHMVEDPSRGDTAPRYIGCPFTRESLEAKGARFRFLDHTEEAAPGIWFLAGLNPPVERRPKDDRLLLEQEGRIGPDLIPDDASLLIQTDKGPILLLGCAHAGVLNILDYLEHDMGIHRLHAILGGTHLMFYGPETVPAFAERIRQFSVSLLAVSHCTGLGPTLELARLLGDRFTIAAVGRVFDL